MINSSGVGFHFFISVIRSRRRLYGLLKGEVAVRKLHCPEFHSKLFFVRMSDKLIYISG